MPQVRSRRELYSEATRAALLDEATRLFAERGYAGTSLEDVASASQVTRGAVYHHFEAKHALFEAGYLTNRALGSLAGFCFWMLGGAGLALAEAPAADKPRVREEWRYLIRRTISGIRAS